MKKPALAIALGLVALGAQAATVSFQFGNPIVQTPTEINQSGVLGLFDTNVGTLTDVELKLNSEMFGNISLFLGGQSTGPSSIQGTSTSDVAWNEPVWIFVFEA